MAIALSFLGLPLANQWLGAGENAGGLGTVAGYLQGSAGNPNAIRVADQLDPLRTEPSKISKQDEQIAAFLAKKYRLAASEVERYVHFANLAAKAKGLDATLVMAVMSIESNLNNITESSAGAQGLMQVLTSVHIDKYAPYGGEDKAFDPATNIMIGATILADCIKLGGSVEMGLKCYVGATGPSDGGYGAKVLAEKERIGKARLGVFDFASNNKVLQDLGILAAPTVEQPDASPAGADLNSQFLKAGTALIPGLGSSSVHPAPSPSVLPPALPVALPVPPVSPVPLYSAHVESHPNATSANTNTNSKQK